MFSKMSMDVHKKTPIALTFLSNAYIIPDKLLSSSACFRLYRHAKLLNIN